MKKTFSKTQTEYSTRERIEYHQLMISDLLREIEYRHNRVIALSQLEMKEQMKKVVSKRKGLK